jgi:hypothetical protein
MPAYQLEIIARTKSSLREEHIAFSNGAAMVVRACSVVL